MTSARSRLRHRARVPRSIAIRPRARAIRRPNAIATKRNRTNRNPSASRARRSTRPARARPASAREPPNALFDARVLSSRKRARPSSRALCRARRIRRIRRARARRVVRTFGDTHTRMRIQCATTSDSVGCIFSPLARAHMGLKASPMRRSDAIGRAIARRPRRRARASPRTLSRTHSPCSPKSSPSPPRPSPRPSTPSPSAVTPSFAVTPRVAKKARCVHDDDDDATRDDDDYRDDDADDDAKRARLTTVDRSESHSARTTTMRSV